MKYYVIYGEDDEDISENEEVHQHKEEGEASCMNKLKLRPHTRTNPCLPFDVRPQAAGDLKFEMLGVHAAASNSDAEDESEDKAVVANSDEKD